MITKKHLVICFGVLIPVLMIVGLSLNVFAMKWDHTPYFTNTERIAGGGIPVLPEWNRSLDPYNRVNTDSGYAIPSWVTSIDTLVQFLKYSNWSSHYQRISGSAYIVCSMLGADKGNQCNQMNPTYPENCHAAYGSTPSDYTGCYIDVYTRKITSAGWDALVSRLNAYDASKPGHKSGYTVNWEESVSLPADGSDGTHLVKKSNGKWVEKKYFLNSLWDTTENDVYIYKQDTDEERNSITFKVNGVVKYRIFRMCANPVGNVPGLPITSNYALTPGVDLSVDDAIEAGTVGYNVWPWVTKTGTTDSLDTAWILEKGINDANYYEISAAGSHQVFSTKSTALPAHYEDKSETNYVAGTRICYKLSVTPRSSTDGSKLTSSPPHCVVIGERPKVQIWGNDLRVRGSTDTSTSTKDFGTLSSPNVRMFGSWVEYAIFAGGTIKGTASGSVFVGDGASASGMRYADGVCGYSPLSFTNSNKAGCTSSTSIGGYTSNLTNLDVAAAFPISTGTRAFSGGNLNDMQGLYRAGDVTIGPEASTINSGHWVVINAGISTVTINGNIQYADGPYEGIYGIPQVIIIAGRIIIDNSVTNVDAWLVAKKDNYNPSDPNTGGSVQTCQVVALTIYNCPNPLRINGPVITDRLFLYRTDGVGPGHTIGDPAEVFNLRADTYLWAYAYVSRSGNIKTVYTTELPPRF